MTTPQLIDSILGNFTTKFTSEKGSKNIGLCDWRFNGIAPVDLDID
jgi:hypothetical protein